MESEAATWGFAARGAPTSRGMASPGQLYIVCIMGEQQVVGTGSGPALSTPYFTAFFTSAAIFFSSAAVSCFSANDTGHMGPL